MANIYANNDFLVKIQSIYPALTKAEKKVADFTLKNAKDVRFMSIVDLAAACNVGLTSVFRFCKALKLHGYQEFKIQLSLSLTSTSEEEVLPAQITKSDTVDTAMQKLLQSHVNALTESRLLLDQTTLCKAAEFVMAADQVRFFGMGSSMLTAMEGMYKFLHIMPNVYCLSDLYMQTIAASTMNCHDVAIFISHSGESKELVAMAKKAQEGGAKTICITRYPMSTLTQFCQVVLLCGGYEPPLQEGSFPTKTAQLFVLDMLFTEIYRRKFDYSMEINRLTATSIGDKNF